MMDAFNGKQTPKVLLPTGILYNYKSWVPFLIHSSSGGGMGGRKTQERMRKISANSASVSDMLYNRHLSNREEEVMAT